MGPLARILLLSLVLTGLGVASAVGRVEAATPPSASPVTPAQLEAGFKADKSKWLGKRVVVDGLYMNTNSAKIDGKSIVNVVVVQEKGKFDPSVTCYLKDGDSAKSLMQYDPVRVEGTVREGFGAQLEKCTVTKR